MASACLTSLTDNLSVTAAMEYGRNFDSLVAVSQRIEAGESARIVTLGGSLPYGNNCVRPNGDHHRACSWPGRLVHALRAAFPQTKLIHDNLASGGNGVVHILSTLGIVLAQRTDLILLDTLVNDAWRSGSATASQALEALVRTARQLAPSAALLVVESAPPGLGDEVAHEKRRILQHYGIATLDWHAAVSDYPSLWHPGPIVGTMSTDINHPSWETHQQIADTAAALWGRAARRACRRGTAMSMWWPSTTVWSKKDLSAFDVCLAPLSIFTSVGSTEGAPAGSAPSHSRGWRFYADKPNKYGWISEKVGSSISFNLQFGAAPRFMMTYLRSYERIGRIALAIPTAGFRVVVDALWTDRASQSDVLWFGTTEGHDMTISYNTHFVPLRPNSTHTLEARLLDTPTRAGGNKFKIMQVVSC
jgi:hypothetical protein